MKNVIPYYEDAFEFHKNVTSRKKVTIEDPEYKTRVLALDTDIEQLYVSFEDRFQANRLELLNAHGYTDPNKKDLLSLYSFKSKLLQQLKLKLTTTSTNRIVNTCQNCTINEINSFDHFLPKAEFAEFAVNPKNLFPSCTACNGYKMSAWREKGKRVFLNLYLDALPIQQYLFVNITLSKKGIETEFYTANTAGIDGDLFTLIDTHYKRLHLFERFSDNNDSVITPLRNNIEPYIGELSIDKIKQSVIATSKKNMIAFGSNYWKSVLEIALVNNADFMRSFNP